LFDYILLIIYNPLKGGHDPESGRSPRGNKRVVVWWYWILHSSKCTHVSTIYFLL